MGRTAILFDLDGTLADAFADIAAAVNGALGSRSLPVHSVEVIRTMVGNGIAELCRRAAPALPAQELPAFLEDVRARYAADPVSRTVLYPGVRELLRELQSRAVPMAILSNKPHALTIEVCGRLGLTPFVAALQGEDPPRIPQKPDPAGARAVLAALGTTDAVVVGDMAPDGQLARNLDVPFIAALWSGATTESLQAFDPIALCRDPREVIAAMDSLPTLAPEGRR